ncbi:MAG: polyprenyl synthetase family protein [Lysobacterales bacterium]
MKTQIETLTQRVNGVLDGHLPAPETSPQKLHQAMRYAVFNGGKRIRPLFAYGAASALDISPGTVDGAAAAVELIHAYSLIHDDLPAMDDDDLRRGKPSVHKQFDEALAILAGDALQALAFRVLVAGELDNPGGAVAELADACGSVGMAGGQAVDLGSVGKALDVEALSAMHSLKTGALIRCSLTLPGFIANATDNLVNALAAYGNAVGLAFQIHDDVLDIEGSTEALGKPSGSDENSNKPTYPACLGLEQSKRMARDLVAKAQDELTQLPGDTALLNYLSEFSIKRHS